MDWRRWGTPTLRLAATVAMLAWLGSHVELSELRVPPWSTTTFVWLAAASGTTLVGVVLAALRWQRVLAALDEPVATPVLVRHNLAGMFVGNFLPTTIGGDVLRTSRLSSATGRTPTAVASVVLERMTGWLVLPLLTLTGLLVNPGLRRHAPGPAGTAMGMAVVTLLALAVVVVLVASPNLGGRLDSTAGWRRFTGAVHAGMDRVRRRPGLAFEILTVGFAYQLAVVLSAFLAAKALGLYVGWTALLAFFPVVAMVQVLPLTVSGLGTREAALVFFLQPLGVAQADAFALGLLVYFVTLGVSLLGAPAFALGNRARARVLA